MVEETSEPKVLELTERELKEIKHALFYQYECNHGTAGHNQLILIAKMANHLGFDFVIDPEAYPPEVIRITIPEAVNITHGKQ